MKHIAKQYGQRWMACGRAIALFLFGMTFALSSVHGKAGMYLVGLGPGDPELATVKAIRLLQGADLIYAFDGDIRDRFVEYLKNKEVRVLPFDIFTRQRIRKAKAGSGAASREQLAKMDKERRSLFDEVKRAVNQGKQVVFIDNGDPLIYGPWVWMLEELKDIHPEVVPGISSFNAGLAALKRDGTWARNTHSVILTTDRPQSQDRLEALAAHRCSMAVFTHRTKFEEIIHKLKTSYPPETPIAVVLYAGYKEKQAVIHGNLETIKSLIRPETLPLEHIIFVGDFLTYDINKN